MAEDLGDHRRPGRTAFSVSFILACLAEGIRFAAEVTDRHDVGA